ncbi:MAG: sec-independent protein translocase protein TatA [Mycobacterium sp.]|jgi:sec-independent protein translocase protein TatA|nr:sec-independent protein translocase protein TatA [Mycobacterium sp.]
MINGLQPWHVIILVVVLVLLFGAKKLPDAARSLGKSMRIFKSEMHELTNEGKSDEKPNATTVQSERVDSPAPEQNHTDARPA